MGLQGSEMLLLIQQFNDFLLTCATHVLFGVFNTFAVILSQFGLAHFLPLLAMTGFHRLLYAEARSFSLLLENVKLQNIHNVVAFL